MSLGILGVLDDLAMLADDVMSQTKALAVVDDIVTQSKAPLQSTAGIIGDDLALGANNVQGLRAEREIPVVTKIHNGGLRNKLVLAPIVFSLYYFAPWTLPILLAVGGLYLCYEGFEKVWHHFFHKEELANHSSEVKKARASGSEELLNVEQVRIKNAIKTDAVISIEIICIVLNQITHLSGFYQLGLLLGLVAFINFAIYFTVGLIVKADDLGLFLMSKKADSLRWLGSVVLRSVPYFLKTLSVVGTLAMFLVGGELVFHNVAPIHHLFSWVPSGWLYQAPLAFAQGVVYGAMILTVFSIPSCFKTNSPRS